MATPTLEEFMQEKYGNFLQFVKGCPWIAKDLTGTSLSLFMYGLLAVPHSAWETILEVARLPADEQDRPIPTFLYDGFQPLLKLVDANPAVGTINEAIRLCRYLELFKKYQDGSFQF